MKLGLSIIALALFVGNFTICNFVFGNDVVNWWKLRMVLLSSVIALMCYVAHDVHQNKYLRYVLINGMFLSSCDVVSRIVGITNFGFPDIVLIAVSLWFSFNIIIKDGSTAKN